MSDKLCVIILDALGPYNIRQLEMDYVCSLYESEEYSSGLLCTSGLAHTPISNPRIWGNYVNDEHIWVQNHPHRWSGGIDGFDPIFQEFDTDRAELYRREDLETNFIWDILDYHGFQVSALGIPLCLPPYCYNEEDRLEDAWFPHTPEKLEEHVRRKPEFILEHIEREDDFICTSIKVPDQWLHAQGSDIVDEKFVEKEVPVLEERLKEVINELEANGYDWLIFGDHGSPWQGRTANFKQKKLLARHRKEAAIIGSTDTIPKYTNEMLPFFLDYFGVENIDRQALITEPSPEREVVRLSRQRRLETDAVDRLKNVIDNDSILLWTGGKEANVLADMLINKIGNGTSPVPFRIIDTGNHYDEIYKFREQYLNENNVEYKVVKNDELLSVINDPDDPRGYHGEWKGNGAVDGITENDWGVTASCGKLKIGALEKIIQNYDTLITGQRHEDPLTNDDISDVTERRQQPLPHTRINPLFDWERRNVYSYIQYHNVSLPSLYTDKGFIHTDAKCCTSDDQISEYGDTGRDEDKLEAAERLQQMGYL